MKKQIFIFLMTVVFYSTVHADTWNDPEWDEMINESEVIGQFEVIQGGTFKAELKPLKIYKGKIKKKTIWLTGFSNKYGPIDTLQQGDKYILFLFRTKLYKGRFMSMSNSAQKSIAEEARESYIFVSKKKNGYSVWTPTAGELQIERDSIRYNLLQTSSSRYFSLKPLPEFEKFLEFAIKEKLDTEYQQELATKLEGSLVYPKEDMSSQYLMMMHLSHNNIYYDIFKKALQDTVPETRFALARHMGKWIPMNREIFWFN